LVIVFPASALVVVQAYRILLGMNIW
jgi:hypothetical protein